MRLIVACGVAWAGRGTGTTPQVAPTAKWLHLLAFGVRWNSGSRQGIGLGAGAGRDSHGCGGAAVEQIRNYWTESARPLPSLLFVAPMIVAYEVGVGVLGPRAPRNGADVWLRSALEQVGFAHQLLLPLLTCGLLLAWHHMRREQWRVGLSTVSGMAVESALLGLLLLGLANVMSGALDASPSGASAGGSYQAGRGTAAVGTAGRVVGYLGAGIYEELLFRLLLLLPAAWGLTALGLPRRWSLVGAGVATSLLFAMAHYDLRLAVLGQDIHWNGESWNATTFAFRALAGGFFSALFVLRGFGIAAGAHALYDIFVAVL